MFWEWNLTTYATVSGGIFVVAILILAIKFLSKVL